MINVEHNSFYSKKRDFKYESKKPYKIDDVMPEFDLGSKLDESFVIKETK